MKADNTPTVTARRRDPSAKQRLRRQIGIKKHEEAQFAKAGAAAGGDAEASTCECTPTADALAASRSTLSKFKKRQINKTWLPTHLWHAKRAHMTPAREPLWGFAIPLTPTDKSYRMTHRASSLRGCVAWDTSYTSTISIEGGERSVLELFSCLSMPEAQLGSDKGLAWRQGKRSWFGWVRQPQKEQAWIAKVLMVWAPPAEGEAATRQVLVRVHPSAFCQLWGALLEYIKSEEAHIKLKDLRYELGSLEIAGPGAMEALFRTLKPFETPEDHDDSLETVTTFLSKLAAVTDSRAVPQGALLSLSVADPRLGSPHRKVGGPDLGAQGEELAGLLSNWPIDQKQANRPLFERSARHDAAKHLLTQKAINRRKASAPPGSPPSPLPTAYSIPILILAQNHEQSAAPHGSWTIMLPWKCVLSVWYPLMYYPLSDGGNPRFGGLEQMRQTNFERGLPWFPRDHPGTKAGWLWEQEERARRKAEWDKRPKGRRIEWSSIDLGKGRTGELGRGWACDWEYLIDGEDQGSINKEPDAKDNLEQLPDVETQPPARCLPQPRPSSLPDPRALTPVLITLTGRGLPTACARIYRLPTHDPTLRAAWLALAEPAGRQSPRRSELPIFQHKQDPSNREFGPDEDQDAPKSSSRALLATSLLQGSMAARHELVQADDPSYPVVPDARDLIGFVTTGNFNLGKGRGIAIGNIVLARMNQISCDGLGTPNPKAKLPLNGFCVIREAGNAVGRLARWKVTD